MIDYRLRVHRRFPQKQMRQAVIYLQSTGSDLVQQNAFTLEKTRHEFEVIRLWEQPASAFLQSPGLLPFAVLSQVSDRAQTLRQVAQLIDQMPDPRAQSNVLASTFILAGLVLESEVIQQVLRRDIMQESVTYQLIKSEGREEGREEALRQIVANLTREGMSPDVIARITGLTIEQIQQVQTAINQP